MRTGALQHSQSQDSQSQGDRSHLELVRQSVTTAATLAHERTLPVVDELASLVPSGRVQRGSTLAFHGIGATSLALAVAGQAVRDGSFLAIVAPPSFGLASCLDFDIPLRRVVLFSLAASAQAPRDEGRGANAGKNWVQAVAAIVEGFDVVVLADRHRVGSSQARQLTARTRERGSVLMRVGGPSWPDAADLRFDVSAADWSGLGQGYGYLQARQVGVQVAGRRYHGSHQSHPIMLPAFDGGVEKLERITRIERVETKGAVTDTTERFAGADIDAFLDAADRAENATDDDLNAIA